MINFYRPNMSFNQSHSVEVTLMFIDYKASVVFEVSGNVAGSSVLESTIDNFEDGYLESFPTENELNQRHLDFTDPENKYSGAETIYLFREDGSSIGFSHDEEVLRDLVVGAKIIAYSN